MADFVRNGRTFKNIRLRDFLAKYYRANASVGNGSSADALLYEAKSGILLSQASHLQKEQNARTFFIKLLNNGSSGLSDFEKEFVVRQILEASSATKAAVNAGL